MPTTPTSHERRRQLLDTAARAHGWRLVQDTTMKILDGSCLYDIARRSRHYENFVFGDDWEYAEIGFPYQVPRRLRRDRTKLVHYAVMSMCLPRKLPNVVFDSLKHQRRQFRLVFDADQYIQLEGNFDKYFATYFPFEYTIDSLSFITPEVMEALIAADDYDIEIVHDRVLLFGPIKQDAEAQLKEMSQAIKLIHRKLLNNIRTYRDERVPYDIGRKVVARTGMFLTGSPPTAWDNFALAFIIFRWLIIGLAAIYVISWLLSQL